MASKLDLEARRRRRLRFQLRQKSGGRVRLSVFRSGKHIYAQIIDDKQGRTLAAASSIGKPPTPVPNATRASERAPSSSATRSALAVAPPMISADVGPPRCIVAAWITQRHGSSPAPVATAPPNSIGAAAAVAQLGVGRVGDRVHVELGDVGFEHLDSGHARNLARLPQPASAAPTLTSPAITASPTAS